LRLEVGSLPVPLGVLVSGGGSNLQAILNASREGELRGVAAVALVIANHVAAPALVRAQAANVPTAVVERESYASRLAQQLEIASKLKVAGVRLVVCAGFDRILAPEAVEEIGVPILNLHPSLLPAFGGGLYAIRDALAHGVKVTGCTVHLIAGDYGVDAGPIVAQEAVLVADEDDEASLSQRVHAAEHRTIVRAIRVVCGGGLRVEGRRVLATATKLAIDKH